MRAVSPAEIKHAARPIQCSRGPGCWKSGGRGDGPGHGWGFGGRGSPQSPSEDGHFKECGLSEEWQS